MTAEQDLSSGLGSGSVGSRPDFAALDRALGGPDYYRDPYAVLSRIREDAPVYRSAVLNGWLISRFRDVAMVLRDNKHFSAKMFGKMVKRTPETHALVELIENNMIGTLDPPEHTRLRRILVEGIFTPARLAALRTTVIAIANQVFDKLETGKSMDVIGDLTQPVAFGFLARFLGVAPEDAGKFLTWAGHVAEFMLQTHADDDAVRRGVEAFAEIRAYVEAQIEQRVAQPADDIFGLLVEVRERENLGSDEILATAMQMVFAGASTSANGLANTIYLLLRNPEQFEALRADPAGLVHAAFEEGLRCESPVFFTYRISTADVTFQGTTIPAGETVIVNLGGANRDADVFPNPERFDLSRPRGAHVAFGFGAHLCLGERLARLQGEVVLQELIRRFPNLHLSGAEPQWKQNFGLRELRSLPVSW
jgi:cytochrome P450